MSTIEDLIDRMRGYLEPEEVQQVRRAYYFAEQAHDGQRRRSGEHYVTHPLAVATILANMHMDHHSLMAAMLHDVIEDTPVTKEALAKQFGDTVADLVDGVSKLTQIHFEDKALAQAENFQKMALAMARDIRVILVKLADRLHNMRTLGALRPDKKRRIARETLDIYAPIAGRLGINTIRTELEDLGFAGMHPMRYERLKRAVQSGKGNRKQVIREIQQALQACLETDELPGKVIGREKHLLSLYRKMKERRKSFSDIMDVYGFRIVTDKVDSCYRILGAIHNLYKPIPGRFKDYIAIPKANGYQSLHTSLIGMNGLPIEVQIRTREMESMANNGIAAHWLYKKSSRQKEPSSGMTGASHARARQWVKGLLEMQQRAGDSLEFIENVKLDLFPDEVYVFTPKGAIMEMPSGATPVDFAYAVHTDVGNSCVAARINRRLSPLSTVLESGQSVEIITAPSARPSLAWLSFVTTAKARSAIRHYVKSQHRTESVSLGKRLLNKALDNYGKQYDDIAKPNIQALLTEFQYQNEQDLLEAIGLGNRVAFGIARALINESETSETPLENESSNSKLAISGTEGMVISYARCCHPIPGDPVLGHISSGRGIVIHMDNCRNIAELRNDSDRCIALEWTESVKGDFTVVLRVEAEHQKGFIAELASLITEADANIEKITTEERDAKVVMVNIELGVQNRVHLARVMRRMRSLSNISRLVRARR
ncbi:GTP pyrophosphokinase [Oceanospirillum multiglobuliferum]|uniref:guanosine-3',5'-bis(diphosphate) 3'-diphosphatase n=1 Tax=Oceanospirillum multiglobuliferum TaxID=64969 RepID=A0A1T4NV29_9GAMM|nr:bifunctional GTP diphosphokinase/guanosine-3',5'-bis pyrophosphate 3'-pyrophosphohydrolase [Oceanospirillum multiglobuliferum]OPX55654.1 bifunctional GTP diphosphokinase/guanosine-3',5'-bis(diphosphate) 3'-diphosphatase [Oceanospirillum multiglobuliferum]SJZ83101.1 GTP pyrophosphokinase [Oceanospirillum multiglobuliferum]